MVVEGFSKSQLITSSNVLGLYGSLVNHLQVVAEIILSKML